MVGVRTVGGLVVLLLAAVYAEEDKPVITLSNGKAMPSVLTLLNNELKEVVCTIKRNDVRLNFQCTFGTIFNGLDVDKVHGGITLKWTFTTTSSMHDEICYCFSSDPQSHIVNSTSQFRFQIYGSLTFSVTNELIEGHKILIKCQVIKNYPFGQYNLSTKFRHSFGELELRVLEGIMYARSVVLSFRYNYQDYGNYTCVGVTNRTIARGTTTTVLDLPPAISDTSEKTDTVKVAFGDETRLCQTLFPFPSIDVNFTWFDPYQNIMEHKIHSVLADINMQGKIIRADTKKSCIHIAEVLKSSLGKYVLQICRGTQCASYSTELEIADKAQPPQMQTGNTGLPIIIVAVIAVVAMISVPIVWDRMKRKKKRDVEGDR